MAVPRTRPLLSRRRFCGLGGSALLLSRLLPAQSSGVHFNVAEYDRDRILAAAGSALGQKPLPLPALPQPVKDLPPGTYYSQDPEWWPAEGKAGSWEHRPGYTSPSAFTAHRDALVGLNGSVAALVAAWCLTAEERYASHAMSHLRAWFLDKATRMEPNLDHAACVPPSTTGTPLGVQETVMLAETARAAAFLCGYNGVASEEEAAALRDWFRQFATWLNESKTGFIAREMKDRLAICWTMQAAEFARFARMEPLQLECSHRFREKLLRQMNFDGQFPAELNRPDAYASSLFTLDCLSVACEALSTPMDRLWDYNLPDGRGMRSAVAFLYPALENRAVWKYPADKEHFIAWPARQPSLLLAGRAYGRPEYIATWKRLPAEPRPAELLRFFPVRQPALWTVRAPA